MRLRLADVMFLSGLLGYFTAVFFTQLMYWKYGYPSSIWVEANPVLHSAFVLGKPWFHFIYALSMVGWLSAYYLATVKGNFILRAFAQPMLYGLSLGFVLDGINDVLVYFLLISIPFQVIVSIMIIASVAGWILLVKEVVVKWKVSEFLSRSPFPGVKLIYWLARVNVENHAGACPGVGGLRDPGGHDNRRRDLHLAGQR